MFKEQQQQQKSTEIVICKKQNMKRKENNAKQTNKQKTIWNLIITCSPNLVLQSGAMS